MPAQQGWRIVRGMHMGSSMNTPLLAAALILCGCAAVPGVVTSPSVERADTQMKTMQEMHQKMMAAKTPEERQALMAEHMKAMHGGMSMMCEMGAGGAGMQGGAGMHDAMKRCMDMKDMTMRMMTDREFGKEPAAK